MWGSERLLALLDCRTQPRAHNIKPQEAGASSELWPLPIYEHDDPLKALPVVADDHEGSVVQPPCTLEDAVHLMPYASH